MINVTYVIEFGRAIRIAYGYDSKSDRCISCKRGGFLQKKIRGLSSGPEFRQTGVSKRQKIVMIVNQVKFIRSFEKFADVETLPDFWIQTFVLFIRSGNDRMQLALGFRIGRCEQSHINSSGNQPLGQERDHSFPRAVMSRRSSPRDRETKWQYAFPGPRFQSVISRTLRTTFHKFQQIAQFSSSKGHRAISHTIV